MIRIIGAQGIIGRNLERALKNYKYLEIQPHGSWNFENVNFGDTIFFLRAMSSPLLVTKNPKSSMELNVAKTGSAIQKIIQRGARVIFASSDVVYGDTGFGYATEGSQINPFGEYAIQKSLLEKKFLKNPNFLSVRVSSVVGEGSKLQEMLMRELQYEVFHPIIRNPIHISDLVIVLIKLIHADFESDFPDGNLNLGGKESMTSYDLAILEAKTLGVREPIKVPRTELDMMSRPATVRMNTSLAQNFANIQLDLRQHYR